MNVRTKAAMALAVLATVSMSLTLSVPASADPPNVPGFEIVSTSTTRTVSPSSQFSTTASCTGGSKLVGVGWYLSAGVATGELVVGEMDVTETSVRVQGYEDQTGFSGNWIPAAYATCMDEPVGYEVVSSTSVTNSTDPKEASVDCPGGTRALGTAFSIAGAGGQASISSLQIGPATDSVSARAREDADGTTASWDLTVYAFCGVAPLGYDLEESSNQTSFPHTLELTSCGPGKLVLGGGFYMTNDDGDVTVFEHRPLEYPLDNWHDATEVREIPPGTPDDWNLTDQAVCVDE